jgi:hypothetical protein
MQEATGRHKLRTGRGQVPSENRPVSIRASPSCGAEASARDRRKSTHQGDVERQHVEVQRLVSEQQPLPDGFDRRVQQRAALNRSDETRRRRFEPCHSAKSKHLDRFKRRQYLWAQPYNRARPRDHATPTAPRSASRADSPPAAWDLESGPAWTWAVFSTRFDHDR